MDSFDEFVDRFIQNIEEWRWIQTNPERHDDQWNQRRQFPSIQIEKILICGILVLPEHRALIEPQHVSRAENNAGASKYSPPGTDLKGAHHDGEFPDESVEKR